MGYLNDLAKQIYDGAAEKGWHDKPVSFGDCLTNIHAELSEAWEEYRHGKALNQTYHSSCEEHNDCNIIPSCNGCDKAKPEGIPSEFADIIIRVLDACCMYDIDIDKIIDEKMTYNKTRTYKHGEKII